MAKKMKQSDTQEIMRSQIRLNPFNPKRHGDEAVKKQRRNFQRVGFLGGIVWNKTTGNIIDGHRRIKALDEYYGYDGTAETDYAVKVEVVEFDDKKEKEQMTFMALANTKADLDLIAEYLPDIDYEVAGISDDDLANIKHFLPQAEDIQITTYDDLTLPPQERDIVVPRDDDEEDEMSPDAKKAHVQEVKQRQRDIAVQRFQDLAAYITISFRDAEEKRLFCDLAGCDEEAKFITGETVLNLIA